MQFRPINSGSSSQTPWSSCSARFVRERSMHATQQLMTKYCFQVDECPTNDQKYESLIINLTRPRERTVTRNGKLKYEHRERF